MNVWRAISNIIRGLSIVAPVAAVGIVALYGIWGVGFLLESFAPIGYEARAPIGSELFAMRVLGGLLIVAPLGAVLTVLHHIGADANREEDDD